VEEAKAEKSSIGGKEAVFEFLAEDDQEDAKVGNTVAQKLVDAKVAGVVGHLNSGTRFRRPTSIAARISR